MTMSDSSRRRSKTMGGCIRRQPCELASPVSGKVQQPERLLANRPRQVHDSLAARQKAHAPTPLCADPDRREIHGAAIGPQGEQRRSPF